MFVFFVTFRPLSIIKLIEKIIWVIFFNQCILLLGSNHFFYEVYSLIFQEAALTQKEKAFEEFKQKNYERSLTLFHLALLLYPQGNSNWMKFKRSIESHKADASFKLQRYVQALEIGEQSHHSNSTVNTVRNVVPLCLSSYLVQS